MPGCKVLYSCESRGMVVVECCIAFELVPWTFPKTDDGAICLDTVRERTFYVGDEPCRYEKVLVLASDMKKLGKL